MKRMHENDTPSAITPHLRAMDIMFFVIAAAAPLGATIGVAPVVFSAAGSLVPLIFLVASAILLMFATGFSAMCKRHVGVGGFAELIRLGLGSQMGRSSAGVAIFAYICMLAGIIGQFSAYLQSVLSKMGMYPNWIFLALASGAAIGALGYRNIDVSRRILGVVITLELAALFALDLALIFSEGGSGFNLPEVANGPIATPELGIAIMFAFACFIGFESTLLYGEEAKDPERSLPKATYGAIAVIGIFYTFTMWCLSIAYRNTDIANIAANDPVNFVFKVSERYLGVTATLLLELMAGFSIVAVLISFHNALARYLHQLASSDIVPKSLNAIHKRHGSPHIASLLTSVATLVVVTLFAAAGTAPMEQLYMWMVALGTLSLICVQALCAISIAIYLYKEPRSASFAVILSTAASGLVLTAVAILCVKQFGALSGLGGFAAQWAPVAIVVAALLPFVRGKVIDQI